MSRLIWKVGELNLTSLVQRDPEKILPRCYLRVFVYVNLGFSFENGSIKQVCPLRLFIYKYI